jgi:hypothetical protein
MLRNSDGTMREEKLELLSLLVRVCGHNADFDLMSIIYQKKLSRFSTTCDQARAGSPFWGTRNNLACRPSRGQG